MSPADYCPPLALLVRASQPPPQAVQGKALTITRNWRTQHGQRVVGRGCCILHVVGGTCHRLQLARWLPARMCSCRSSRQQQCPVEGLCFQAGLASGTSQTTTGPFSVGPPCGGEGGTVVVEEGVQARHRGPLLQQRERSCKATSTGRLQLATCQRDPEGTPVWGLPRGCAPSSAGKRVSEAAAHPRLCRRDNCVAGRGQASR